MDQPADGTIRILVADDEARTRETYRYALLPPEPGSRPDVPVDRRGAAAGRPRPTPFPGERFELVFCVGAEEAVEAVRAADRNGHPIAVAFLDLQMPPGPDGVWAATRIRRADSRVEIVIATPYADLDPGRLDERLAPVEGVFYLGKPVHPHEVRQLASALGRRRLAEERVRRLTRFDSLTGLPGRVSFEEQVGRAIDLARPQGRPVAVLSLGLEDVRRVTDTLGRATGDLLLHEVAKLLTTSLRAGDAVSRHGALAADPELARPGGDEFTVLLPDIGRAEDARAVAERLLATLAAPLMLAGQEVSVAASIGIAVCPDHGQEPAALLERADLAMREARRAGDGIRLYAESMRTSALARLTMESELRRAVERDELSLHFQPQISLPDRSVSGVEALVRWDSSALGPVPPGDFIPVAERTGAIIPIGEWVLRAACEQLGSWQRDGIAPPRISVNVAERQLVQDGFPDLVRRVLAETGLRPSSLELEIAESVLLGAGETVTDALRELKDLGVQLAVDDFGTGYFRLTRLKQFPLDRLKIDRSFVGGLSDDAQDRAITAAVIAMAERMNLTVTAEGVETAEQLFYLTGRRCGEVQGYYTGRPMPAPQVEIFLRRSAQPEPAGPAGAAPV